MKGGTASKKRRASNTHVGLGRASARAQVPESDDDLDDILPVPAVTPGSSAYEALLGGLDRSSAPSSHVMRPKASKVKTHLTAAVGAQQQQDSLPAEQPLDETKHIASSSDDADDRSVVGDERPPAKSNAAHQTAADFFSRHFDGTSAEADTLQEPSNTSVSWKEDPHAQCPWPNASWLTTGPPICQVTALL